MNATTEDKAGQASPPWVLTRVPLDAYWLAAMAANYHVIPWAQADAAARGGVRP